MSGEIAGKKRPKVAVVVLGDIGRSPRMQYHALSLVKNGATVNIISYKETSPLQELNESEFIHFHELHPLHCKYGPKLLLYFFKAFWQLISLLIMLFTTGKSDFLLCQNPPAIPTLPACWFYCLITRCKFVIDWHNYAYSIMALNLSKSHPLVHLAYKIEKIFGYLSDYNFCVTEAMKDDLTENWNIKAKVLYDKPPEMFQPLTLQEKHNWFLKLSNEYKEFTCSGRDTLNLTDNNISERTLFTEAMNGVITERHKRPGLIISSTSWTPDEDFQVLLDALENYENVALLNFSLPPLICVITGKGPMKEYYIEKIKLKSFKYIKIVTPWLESADYPTMVASADLGVCLHKSTSSLDLPMKVVDMFGAGLPVCAYNFKCLNELVKNGSNGYTFENSKQLGELIIKWFDGFPKNQEQNLISSNMKKEIKKFQSSRWHDNWNLRAKKIFFGQKM